LCFCTFSIKLCTFSPLTHPTAVLKSHYTIYFQGLLHFRFGFLGLLRLCIAPPNKLLSEALRRHTLPLETQSILVAATLEPDLYFAAVENK
jgi:hypothetical protein